jgi:hypothetical protein
MAYTKKVSKSQVFFYNNLSKYRYQIRVSFGSFFLHTSYVAIPLQITKREKMKHTKEDSTWLTIRANTGFWFSPKTMRFFGCRVYWHTLTETNGGYLFITCEDNFDRTERGFSVRFVNSDYEIETLGEFLGYETLAEAKKALKSYLVEKVGA